MTELIRQMIRPTWRLWLATECGSSNCSATGWFASGYILPNDASELLRIDCSIPVHAVVLYREHVVCDRTIRSFAQDIIAQTPSVERPRIGRHYIAAELLQSAKGADHSVVDQIERFLLPAGMGRLDRATDDGGITAREMIQIGHDVCTGKGQNPEGLPALFIDGDCVNVARALPTAMPAYHPVSRPNENAQDILKMPGSETEACLAMLRFGVSGFLNGDAGVLEEELRRLMWAAQPRMTAEDYTRLANRMRVVEAQRQDGMYLRRKLRR